MTDLQQLLADYIADFSAGGEADPVAYIERAAPGERDQLAAMIDGYLVRAARQPFDSARFSGSRSERIVGDLDALLSVAAWPVLLPRLRQEKRLKRSDLVSELAKALGVRSRAPKVALYYHQMEQGQLDPQGVSDRVLDALAGLLGSTRQTLRVSGRALGPAGGVGRGVAGTFARSTAGAAHTTAQSEPTLGDAGAKWDEVDELFRGR